ncbi:protein FAM210A-like [Drosophila madeirensis]|uniref:Protein FAM210A-like n=1 Tax=Drosophila madeirensis TaxID=30013 RepID=A0AAU9GCQ6_DROMD
MKTSDLFGDATNMGLFVRFRHMYKQYWYVLIPVHCVASMCWFGGFYYLSKIGVDVPALLQYAHLSETITERVQSSDMGHFAIAFLCFKVVTPLRYSVTLGGTTMSIKFLVKRGYIKPIPSKKQLMNMYKEKKASRRAKADKEEKDGSK